ncbi:hypothetical protein, partial [Streptomyces sp. NPDC001652]|uniref:hypothetical protein n=1 Tax=Streptomyces sp. NPDC001652 TaxID=3154393 RepID=UPI0033327A75
HEDSRTTLLNIAQDTTTPDNARTAALDMLARGWPNQDSWDCAANCVQGAEVSLRETAIRLLALVWPQTSKTAALLVSAAESDMSAEVRATAAQAVAYIEAIAEINPASVPAGELHPRPM